MTRPGAALAARLVLVAVRAAALDRQPKKAHAAMPGLWRAEID